MKSLGFLLLLVALALLISSAVFGVRVGPDEIAIRRIGFGPGQGYQSTPLKPGFHWAMPLFNYSTVSTVPSKVQVLHFHRESQVGDEASSSNQFGPFEVKTRDGAQVICDVSLLIRLYPEAGNIVLAREEIPHNGAAELLRSLGLSQEAWIARIREAASDAILRSLGSLSREQFYNPDERMSRVDDALKLMNLSLARFGIVVEGVLLRRYTYEADQIDQAIFLKNLQDQEEQLNATLVALEVQKKRLTELAAEYDARIKTTLITSESQAQIIRSQGDLAYQQKVADGDLAVTRSLAESDRLKAEALETSGGAEVYLARELAPLVSALRGGVVVNAEPFNLDNWVEQLSGSR